VFITAGLQTCNISNNNNLNCCCCCCLYYTFAGQRSAEAEIVHLCTREIFYYYTGTSCGKHNVTVWCPSVFLSVCPIGAYSTHQEAACDTAGVRFHLSIFRTDVLAKLLFVFIMFTWKECLRMWTCRKPCYMVSVSVY